MVLFDTSALSAVMHRDVDALDRLRGLDPSEVLLASPVAAEIQFGLANLEPGSKRRDMLAEEYRAFRDAVRWADWTEPAAERFGNIKAALRRQGEMIEDFDIVIASIALQWGASVATRNGRHFRRIHGLSVDDWSAG